MRTMTKSSPQFGGRGVKRTIYLKSKNLKSELKSSQINSCSWSQLFVTSREQELTAQLEALQKEKAALEAQVAAFQATPAVATNSTLDAELTVKLVRHTELHYTYPYSQCLRRTLRKSATNFVLKKQVG